MCAGGHPTSKHVPAMPQESISTRVVRAVAEEKGVDPAALPPLHDTVDTDALDALVDDTDRRGGCTVQFAYAGRTVRIHDGDIVLEAPESSSET